MTLALVAAKGALLMLSRTFQVAQTPEKSKAFYFFSSDKKALLAACVLLGHRAQWVISNAAGHDGAQIARKAKQPA